MYIGAVVSGVAEETIDYEQTSTERVRSSSTKAALLVSPYNTGMPTDTTVGIRRMSRFTLIIDGAAGAEVSSSSLSLAVGPCLHALAVRQIILGQCFHQNSDRYPADSTAHILDYFELVTQLITIHADSDTYRIPYALAYAPSQSQRKGTTKGGVSTRLSPWHNLASLSKYNVGVV